ncbi:MAG: serine/threonine-protein kinase [Kofleriaceae bacterium]
MEETAAASAPAMSAQPDLIDRYRIEKRLGAGAMGVVYAAYDPELDRRIAVKLMRPQASADRLRREAQTLAKLSHSNIVTVHDVGMHHGAAFVAMALVDGENLRTWLATPREQDVILEKLIQAMRGIIAAHAEGVIHRDLKPDNIFVSRRGDVLVGDFGLARSSGPPSGEFALGDLTQTGAVMGTPVYMAPEAFAGETTAASDQFSLAVTMWEALYGSRPFRGSSIDELLKSIDAGPPEPPKQLPSRIHAAIVRGLAKDPKDRFPSIAAMLAAITYRRKRWPFVAAAIALLAAGGTAFAVTRPDPRVRALAACDAKSREMLAWSPMRLALLGPIATRASCYADNWLEVAHESCVARADQRTTAIEHAAVERCLGRAAYMFGWAIDGVTPRSIPISARSALDRVTQPERCRGAAVTAEPSKELVELQHRIDEHILETGANERQSTDQDRAVLLETSEHVGDLQARAQAQFVVGSELFERSRSADAEPHLRSAIGLADQAHDDSLRAEANAALGRLLVKGGRLGEARGARDAAEAAARRTNDPLAQFSVEAVNTELASHGDHETEDRITSARKMIALATGKCGPSVVADETHMRLGLALQAAGQKDEAKREFDAGASVFRDSLGPDVDQAFALVQAAVAEPDLHRRIALYEQALPAIKDEESRIAALANLGQDYEFDGDAVLSYRARTQALELADKQSNPDIGQRNELVVDAAAMALDAAERSDVPAVRAQYLKETVALLDRRDKDPDGPEETAFYRGRALYLQGKPQDAYPFVERGLLAAQHQTPLFPGRVALRASLLARILVDIGNRTQAKGYADLARGNFEKAIPIVHSQVAVAGTATVEAFDKRVADFEAWFKANF